jgi:hypothetical protein
MRVPEGRHSGGKNSATVLSRRAVPPMAHVPTGPRVARQCGVLVCCACPKFLCPLCDELCNQVCVPHSQVSTIPS